MHSSLLRRSRLIVSAFENSDIRPLSRRYITSTTYSDTSSLRNQLLRAALDNVPQYGWTDDALVAGSISYFGTSNDKNSTMAPFTGMLSVSDLIVFAMSLWNERFKLELSKAAGTLIDDDVDHSGSGLESLSRSNRYIVNAMRMRLSYLEDLIESKRWHEGMALGLHPSHIGTTQTQLKELIEVICHELPKIGELNNLSTLDKIGLGAVYISVELHMLNSKPENRKETWQFLHDRVHDWDVIRRKTSASMNVLSSNLETFPTSALSDTVFVFTQVASAFASGVVSIANPKISAENVKISHAVDLISNTVKDVSMAIHKKVSRGVDGSNPSHYDTEKKN